MVNPSSPIKENQASAAGSLLSRGWQYVIKIYATARWYTYILIGSGDEVTIVCRGLISTTSKLGSAEARGNTDK